MLYHLKAIGKCKRGAIAPFFALVIVPICLIMLAGIVDYARAMMIKNKVTYAADAAVLSAARSSGTHQQLDMWYQARATFDANFPRDYMGATLDHFNIYSHDGTDHSDYFIAVQVTLPTIMLDYFGLDQFNYSINAAAARREGIVPEVALVLDVSGSMSNPVTGGGTRLEALKDAVIQYANIMYPDFGRADAVTHLVPFSEAVTLNNRYASWVKDYFVANNWDRWPHLTPTESIDCENIPTLDGGDYHDFWGPVLLRAEYYSYRLVQDAPIMVDPPADPRDPSIDPPPYEVPYTDTNNDTCILNAAATLDYSRDLTDAPPGSSQESKFAPLMFERGTNNAPLELQRRIQHHGALASAVSRMDAVGSTSINNGLAWGWYALSPNWNWRDGYRSPEYRSLTQPKFIVLMTDGENTDPGGRFSEPGRSIQQKMDDHTADLCTEIKGRGITIFTIMFTNGASGSRGMLEDCASGEARFFQANSSSDLTQVFKQIADDILSLSISVTD